LAVADTAPDDTGLLACAVSRNSGTPISGMPRAGVSSSTARCRTDSLAGPAGSADALPSAEAARNRPPDGGIGRSDGIFGRTRSTDRAASSISPSYG
jgi:hypothetical protein